MLYVLLAVLCGVVVPALCVKLSVGAFRNYLIQRRNEDFESLANSLDAVYNEEHIWTRRRVMDVLRPAPQWGGMKIKLLDLNNNEIYTLQTGQPNEHRHNNRRNQQQNNNVNNISQNNSQSQVEKFNIVFEHGKLEIEHKIPPMRFEDSFINYLTRYILAGAVIMIITACAVGYFVAVRLSKPVIKAIEHTKKISRGDYESVNDFQNVGIKELDTLSKCVADLGRSLAGQEKLRQRLMTDIAHELRTPLTVTRTQIEAIADGILEPTPERLNLCVNEMERLGNLIEDVEALSRLEGDNLKIRAEKIDVEKFLNTIAEAFEPLFKNAGINFKCEAAKNFYDIDADRFRHAIDNLLSNALRYTDSGGQVILKSYADKNNLIIQVQDTGIGISEQDLPNIFERFYRTDTSRARVTGGRGVGLSIVKATVEAHGGKISVTSTQGEGSCFTITLPI